MEHDRSGSTSLNAVEDGGIYLISVCLGGLVLRTESTALGGLLFKPPPIFAIVARMGHV